MPPIRVSSLVKALQALSISSSPPSEISSDDMDVEPSPIQEVSPPGPASDNQHAFTTVDYQGDASVVGRWVKYPRMLERFMHTGRFPMRKFPLCDPPNDLHWGDGESDSFLFLGTSPAVVYLPAKLISLEPRKTELGTREILLEAELLSDNYYFGMVDLFNLTGDDPTMDPLFYAYRNTGSNRPFKSCWDCSGHPPRPRKVNPSRFHKGDVVLIECSVRRTGSTYVNWYSFFSLRAVSLLYRPARW